MPGAARVVQSEAFVASRGCQRPANGPTISDMTRFLLCSLFLLGCAVGAAPPVEPGDPACECEERVCGTLECGKICGTCPADSTCSSDGRSCLAPLPVGTACESDRQCGIGRICLRATPHLPGGYCTRACSNTERCPDGAECGLSQDGASVCVAVCAGDSSCRASEGYACIEGVCDPCVGTCDGLVCGDDGCGGECGEARPNAPICQNNGDVCSAGACEQSFEFFGSLTSGRWDMSALAVSNGRIALVGGRERIQYGGSIGTRGVGTVEVFTPGGGFSPMQELPEPIARPHAAVVGGLIYVAGGTIDPDLPESYENAEDSAATALYKQVNQGWQTLPLPEASMGGSAEAINDELYLLPGEVNGEPSNSFWLYRQPQWERLQDRPTARTLFSTATDGDRLWVIGGWDGTEAMSTVETWSATTGWQMSQDLPIAVASSRAVWRDGKVFVFGGFNFPDGGDVRPFVQEIDVETGRTQLLGTTRDYLTRQAPVVTDGGKVLLFGAYEADRGIPLPRTDILEFLVP